MDFDEKLKRFEKYKEHKVGFLERIWLFHAAIILLAFMLIAFSGLVEELGNSSMEMKGYSFIFSILIWVSIELLFIVSLQPEREVWRKPSVWLSVVIFPLVMGGIAAKFFSIQYTQEFGTYSPFYTMTVINKERETTGRRTRYNEQYHLYLKDQHRKITIHAQERLYKSVKINDQLSFRYKVSMMGRYLDYDSIQIIGQ